VNGFIDRLYTRLGSTSTYSATAKLHIHKSPQHTLSPFPACCVFTSRSLATAYNSGDSSASRSQIISERQLPSNCLFSLTDSGAELIWLESELLYDWWFIAHQFVLVTSNFFFSLNTCFHGPYITSSLTRGWVCSLQFLLTLASAVNLRSKSRGTHDHILLSQIRDSPNLEAGPRIYIPQEQGGPVIPPGTGCPLRRLLRLAGLRWRYSNPPPHGMLSLIWLPQFSSLQLLDTDLVDNTVHSCMLTVSAGMCSRYPARGYVTPFIKNTLPQQRASFRDRYPSTGLYTTVYYIELLYFIT
jgi:hypothetical protein